MPSRSSRTWRSTPAGTPAAGRGSSPTSGTLSLAFERGTLQLRMNVGTAPPHLIEGLLVTGTQIKGDSLTTVIEDGDEKNSAPCKIPPRSRWAVPER